MSGAAGAACKLRGWSNAPAVKVAVFERVPLVVVELVMWTLAPIAGARLPNEQARICAPTPPEMLHVPGPVYAGLMDQLTPAPPGSWSVTMVAAPPESVKV